MFTRGEFQRLTWKKIPPNLTQTRFKPNPKKNNNRLRQNNWNWTESQCKPSRAKQTEIILCNSPKTFLQQTMTSQPKLPQTYPKTDLIFSLLLFSANRDRVRYQIYLVLWDSKTEATPQTQQEIPGDPDWPEQDSTRSVLVVSRHSQTLYG